LTDVPDGMKPPVCSRKWCYVDPCKCSIAVPPRLVASENAQQRFQGKDAYWSFETCGSQDESTGKMKEESCALHIVEETCGKVEKCIWTDHKCSEKAIGQLCNNAGVLEAFESSSFTVRPILLTAALGLLMPLC
jgi:hypothetical protein